MQLVKLFISCAFIVLTLQSCDFSFGGCGTYGSTTEYNQEFVLDKEFIPLTVQIGDTLIFRPAEYSHINYTVSKDSPCDGEDYKWSPYYIEPEIADESLADVFKIFEREYIDGSYNTKEVKVGIIGKTTGNTILELTIDWYPKGYRTNKTGKTFSIDLEITRPN